MKRQSQAQSDQRADAGTGTGTGTGADAAAVAVRWRSGVDPVPKVTAKGRGLMAQRILALAKESGVPIQTDRDLVQLLGVLDIGIEVPPALYRALAEVLAHLYRANRKLAESRLRPGAPP